jgi:adenine phosphoribosyltransferase
MMSIDRLKSSIQVTHNFPQGQGTHYNIFPLFSNLTLRKLLFDEIKDKLSPYLSQINLIVGLETDGFLIGTVLADHLKLPFLPIRRQKKLPGLVIQQDVVMDHKTVKMEIQSSYIGTESKVLLVDGCLNDGSVLKAAEELINKAGGVVVVKLIITEKISLKGRDKFDDPDSIVSIVKYN